MKAKEGLAINVEANTDNLVAKLRSIAKHAQALADDLEAIDKARLCPKCGAPLDVRKMYADEEETIECVSCSKCNFQDQNVLSPRSS